MADRPDVSMNPAIIDEFRANDGKVGGPFEGATLLLLHTTGAKSGKTRINPVMYFRIDGKLSVVGSYAGADVDPAWVHNLRAHPRAHIEIGTESYDVEAREMPRDEREAAFRHVVTTAPGFGGYQSKTERVIPIFELRKV
ncbi:cell entry protein [Mycobacterium kyorinense]|uniref:Cell entry protein n=1 Tax=Mycobacterium kyorinense TaxID=487514 RepID=A0A1A2ZPV4_9MYCO|nr:nitroreductase family deazaflavin-dependent oxidoreductase [Mycobacterium kyorinense]OBI51723.1 cell entry protein [Mycobacterium kyorinense]